MIIGLPIIIIKKIVSKKKICVVPKSNIIPIPPITPTQPEELIEMETFPSKSRIIQVQPINVIDVNETDNQSATSNGENGIQINDSINNSQHGDNNPMLPLNSLNPPVMCFNTSKSNKNLINFAGVLLIILIFIILGYFPLASRLGWITLRQVNIYTFIPLCSIPVLLPTMYFMYKPQHLINVLNDLF